MEQDKFKSNRSFLLFGEATVEGRKTKTWNVRSAMGGNLLGMIEWWAPWRRYTFKPLAGTVFDAACLRELFAFCSQQTEQHAVDLKTSKEKPCPHERLNEDGICRACGTDRRGL